MNLSKIILAKLMADHSGKEKAIKRKDLLDYAREFSPDVTDRELRNIYCGLEVCSCNRGIFYPVKASEIREFKYYLIKKVRPMRDRWEMVAMKHQSLMEFEQMQLF